jgi:hypothetical protein
VRTFFELNFVVGHLAMCAERALIRLDAPGGPPAGPRVEVTPPEHSTSYLTSLKASALQASVNSAVVSLPSVSVSNFWVSGVAAIAVR